jgi:hypothetical protein
MFVPFFNVHPPLTADAHLQGFEERIDITHGKKRYHVGKKKRYHSRQERDTQGKKETISPTASKKRYHPIKKETILPTPNQERDDVTQGKRYSIPLHVSLPFSVVTLAGRGTHTKHSTAHGHL